MRLLVVVLGTGRSGTAWAARVLTERGWPCGHESVFDWHPSSRPDRRLDYPGRTPSPHEAPGGLVAESSLAAVAYLDVIPADTLLWHVVRRPLDVIASWTHSGILDTDGTPYGAFCRRHVPAIADEPTPVGRAARWVAEWNLRAARGCAGRLHARTRVEDVTGPTVNDHPHPPVTAADVTAGTTPATVELLREWTALAYPEEM